LGVLPLFFFQGGRGARGTMGTYFAPAHKGICKERFVNFSPNLRLGKVRLDTRGTRNKRPENIVPPSHHSTPTLVKKLE